MGLRATPMMASRAGGGLRMGGFSPALAFLDHFAHIGGGAYFEGPILDAGVLGDEFDGVIEIAGFEDEDSAQLFPSFGVGAIGHEDLAVVSMDGLCRAGGLQAFPAGEVAVAAEGVVVG